ncbi:MAG: DUF4352 domain-containing protein [Armatimonadota bacterium]
MNARERLLIIAFAGAIAGFLLFGMGYGVVESYRDRLYWRGRAMLHERQYAEAAALFTRLGGYRDCPSLFEEASYQLNMRRGGQALREKRYPQAVQYFTDAVRYDPGSETAAARLQQAITLKQQANRRLAGQRAGQGDYYLQRQMWPAAYASYKEAVTLNRALLPSLEKKMARARAGMGSRPPATITPPASGREPAYVGSPVGIAVTRMKVDTSLSLNNGMVRKVNGDYRYVKLWVAVKNSANDYVYVNPHEFTLARRTGEPVAHEADTYALSGYFDAADLPPGGKTGGWLVFLLEQDRAYTLRYRGAAGDAEKRLAAP